MDSSNANMMVTNIAVGLVGYITPAVLAMIAVNDRLDKNDGSGGKTMLLISMSILGVVCLYESVLLIRHKNMRGRRGAGIVAIGLIATSFGIMADSSDKDNSIGGIQFEILNVTTGGTFNTNATNIPTNLSGTVIFDNNCLDNMLTPSILDFGVSGTRTSNMMFVAGFVLAAVGSVTLIGEKVQRTIVSKNVLTGVSWLVSIAIVGLGGAVVGLHRRLPEKYDYLGYTDTRGHDIFSTRSTMMIIVSVCLGLVALHDCVDMFTRGSGEETAKGKKFYMFVVVLSWVATILAFAGAITMGYNPTDESLWDRAEPYFRDSESSGDSSNATLKSVFQQVTRDVPPSVVACTEGTYDDYRTGSILISFAIPAAILHAWRSVCLNDFVTPGERWKVIKSNTLGYKIEG